MNICVLGALLSHQKIAYDKAMSGSQALESVSFRTEMNLEKGIPMYKLILLDYSLGDGLDGPDVARQIIRITEQAGLSQPVICCCSAYTEDSFIKKALEAGMQSYITKPVNLQSLLNLLNSIDFSVSR